MERITKEGLPWRDGEPSGERRYIVKGPGLALEVVVCWEPEEGRWRLVAAGRHEYLSFPMPGDDVSDPECELVGGPCEYVGVSLAALETLELLGDVRNVSDERPEAFWQALERLTMGRSAHAAAS
jgi:hypothetical protein